jgi:hypothetical protein
MLSAILLSVIMLSVIMLSITMLSVIMLSVICRVSWRNLLEKAEPGEDTAMFSNIHSGANAINFLQP